jgi:hypothetical protein
VDIEVKTKEKGEIKDDFQMKKKVKKNIQKKDIQISK